MATVVIANQPTGQAQGMQQNTTQWSTGMFGCFEDCGGCIFAYFFFPCYLCRVAGKMKENCCVAFLGGQGEIGVMLMRTKMRTAFGIQGSICEDFCCAAYCPQLTACQIDREMDARGTNNF